MKHYLTQRNVATLLAGEYRDLELPRFVLRVRSKARTYGLKYEHAGETIRVVIGDAAVLSLADARKQARALLTGAWAGTDPREAMKRLAHAGVTVEDLAKRCMAAIGPSLSAATRKEYARILDRELEPIKDLPAVALTGRQVSALLDDILPQAHKAVRPDGKRRRSGYIANRTFEFLRRVYVWGVSREIVTGSPMVGMKKRFDERENERFLSTDEVRAFVRAIDDLQDAALRKTGGRARDPRATAAMLLALTGVRRRAVLGARVEEFEQLEEPEAAEELKTWAPVWHVPGARMKSGRAHTVPLSKQAARLVYRRVSELGGGSLLFPSSKEVKGHEEMWWSSRWVKKMRAAMDAHLGRAANRWRIHDLRATMATQMTESLKVSPTVVDLILDHAPDGPRVRRRYNKATLLDARREAMQIYADWIDGLRRSGMMAATGTGGGRG